MKRTLALMAGAGLILLFATMLLVVMPYLQLSSEPPAEGLKPYSDAALRGRQVYISLGCVYCHSQQPRDPGFSLADSKRGWGRAAVPGDYAYDAPHLMGTMRTGPDLFNIGARQPSEDWQLLHLYDPRAAVPGSIMPAYRFLFEVVDRPLAGDRVVKVPVERIRGTGVVIATQEALDLVAYLKSLDHTYPTDALPRTEPSEVQP